MKPDRLDLQEIQEFKERLVRLAQQDQQAMWAELDRQVQQALPEQPVAQVPLDRLATAEPQDLLARQVLLAQQGLLDPQAAPE